MAEIKTIYKGESITLLFTFPAAYDMARLATQKVFVGETEFAGVKDGQTVKMQLKSSDTDRMIGTHKVVLWMNDATLGLRKPYCGELIVAKTQAAGNTVSVSNISDIIIPIVISETAITVGDVLYNYVKGDPFTYSDFTPEQLEALKVKGDAFEYSDFTPEQIEALKVKGDKGDNEFQTWLAQGNEGTYADYLAVLQQPATEAAGTLTQAVNTKLGEADTAIQNAETATTNASNAASLANAKAGLADTKATLADQKANLADAAATNANTKAGLADTAATNANNVANTYASELALKELKANKQNNLAVDGTGTKFPTVDAVNAGLGNSGIRALFIARGATYNATTGFYSLNGLTDITEAQMMDIYNYTSQLINSASLDEQFSVKPIRTAYSTTNRGNLGVSARFAFAGSTIEVFKQNNLITANCISMFRDCLNLTIVDYISLGNTNASTYTGIFHNCTALVTCLLRSIASNLSLQWSPLLSLASLQYLIQYRANGTTPITITVHPTVFAKLTNNTNYPTWYAVNQDALTKYITFASA